MTEQLTPLYKLINVKHIKKAKAKSMNLSNNQNDFIFRLKSGDIWLDLYYIILGIMSQKDAW